MPEAKPGDMTQGQVSGLQVFGQSGWVYFGAAMELTGEDAQISMNEEKFRLALPVHTITECRSVPIPGIMAAVVTTSAQIYVVLATFPEIYQAIVAASEDR